MSADLHDLRKLPIKDKLEIIEQLWDDIGASGEPFPFPEWIRQEAGRRLTELKANPESALTRREVWSRVNHTER